MTKEKEESKDKGEGGTENGNADKSGDKSKKDEGKSKNKEEDSSAKIRYAVRDDILKGEGPTPFYIAVIMAIYNLWLFIHDCLTFVFHAVFDHPAEKLRKSKRQKARPIIGGDKSKPWRNVENRDDKLLTELFPGCDTIDKMWAKMVDKYGDADCLGTREVIKVHQEKQEDGRIFEKWEQGEYIWETYNDVEERSRAVASGLLDIGHKRGQNMLIFAETRADWMISALAGIRCGIPVVTVQSTLSDEAIIHSFNETEASTLIISAELIPKVQELITKCGLIKRIIYFLPKDPDAMKPDLSRLLDFCADVMSFEELEERGHENLSNDANPKPSDIAFVMYTSGTTGLPKGVIITHTNLIAATAGQGAAIPILSEDDTYIGYLPLAHILELCAEFTVLAHGCRVGYSSPMTLQDQAPKVKEGTKGDCFALRPTLLAAVPEVMDRIYEGFSKKLRASSRIAQEFFLLNYERKCERLENGLESHINDRLLFKKIRDILGGELRGILTGGAPLEDKTQRFINACFGCPVVQGYGLTETCGVGTIADMDDLTTGTVGAPLRCCDIMLQEWKDFSPENDPPQGEILISGQNLAAGYYKNQEQTDEVYITIKGRRWFATGDIGEFRADGCLSIIDRKKNIKKTSKGEYVPA